MDATMYAASLAAELFRMIASAKAKGVNLAGGFRNHVFESPTLAITYLVLPRRELLKISALPSEVRRWVRRTNALVYLERKGDDGSREIIGVHLLWATDTPLTEIAHPQAVEAALVLSGVRAYTTQLQGLLQGYAAAAMGADA